MASVRQYTVHDRSSEGKATLWYLRNWHQVKKNWLCCQKRATGEFGNFKYTGWRKKNACFFISSCDLFLWGYLKSKVYVRKPRTVDDLKVSIREEIANVPQEMLVNVMQNFEERLRTCLRQEGRHLSDIIFRNWVINVSNQNCIYYRLFWC